MASFEGSGTLTWQAWEKGGLTSVPYGQAASSLEAAQAAFDEAAANADAIQFNVTNFDPSYTGESLTNFEFESIVNNPSLFQKTTFIRRGQQVFWNGADFVP
ncbi:MAG TPA: hypothetical protein VMX38_20715 [Verrucomicrobiae bacterium]|nr:hypothetical protein [Verrucomicrobiae bacterium]